MTFDELIKANIKADNSKGNRLCDMAADFSNAAVNLFESIDKEMLSAIRMFAPNGNRFYIFNMRSFACNGTKVSVSESTYHDTPIVVIIQHECGGIIRRYSTKDGMSYKPCKFFASFDGELIVKETSFYDLAEKDGMFDHLDIPCPRGLLKFASHRMVGDCRNFFQTVNDNMASLVNEFKKYLEERANATK